jgi:hypothetical protein
VTATIVSTSLIAHVFTMDSHTRSVKHGKKIMVALTVSAMPDVFNAHQSHVMSQNVAQVTIFISPMVNVVQHVSRVNANALTKLLVTNP